MPPKPKFTKEQIVAAALELVSEKGMEALTSRELGAKLGSSARPIFTVFSSMEEVQAAVRDGALKRFEGFAQRAFRYSPVFKQIGMQMILFAMDEPKLYQLLFMSENASACSFQDIFENLGEMGTVSIEVLQQDYGLTEEDAMALFQHVWIHTFGIGALCATGACDFSEEQILQMMGQDFMAMLCYAKSGRMNQPTPIPQMGKR